MAFGFTPQFKEELFLENFTPQQYLVFALEAAKSLGWEFTSISDKGFVAINNNVIFRSNAELTFSIEGSFASIVSKSTGSEMADFGRNKKLVFKFRDAFIDVKYAMQPDEAALKYEEYSKEFVAPEDDILRLPPPSTSSKVMDAFSLFIPRKGYFITPILIDLNILIFILMAITGVSVMQPDNESLLKWGANFRPVTLEGEWWRLFTCCFLHIGILHLLMNMYALLYIGILLEPYLGKTRFLSAYLLTGIMASTASLYWHDLIISAGASGAIFGMYGVFLAMLTTNLIDKNARMPLLASIGIFVGYNLLNGMKAGIDNAAHVGGLVTGLLIGYAFLPSLKKSDLTKLKWSVIGIFTALVILTSFTVYKTIPNDIAKYDNEMKKFAENEAVAMGIYKMNLNQPKDLLLKEVKEKGLFYWNENLKLINELEKLDLPAAVHNRNQEVIRYCELRIKVYNLIYKAIDENTDKYTSQLTDLNRQIQEIIDKLKNTGSKEKE